MENNRGPKQLSPEGVAQFRLGIDLVLSRWQALQVAIQNEWGGRDSCQIADQFPLDILSRFTQTREPIYIDEVEDLLDELTLSLNTQMDDGSVEEIAEKIMVMHEECLEGNFSSIERLKEAGPARVAVPHIRQGQNDDEDDSDSSSGEDNSMDMVVDGSEALANPSQKEMVVDEPRPSGGIAAAEDGWTVVGSKKNRGGRRN